jgi:hypothetical protein
MSEAPAQIATTHDAADLEKALSDAVATAFRAYTEHAQSQRADLYALTMSGLGSCTRQAAYRVARTAPSEPLVFQEMREANIGTMIHLGLLPHLAAATGGTEEIAVTLHAGTLTIDGRTDLYSERLRAVIDLKTVGTYKFAGLGATIVPAHRLQVAGYAQAIRQSNRAVDWIAWAYLDRSSGSVRPIVEPWSDELEQLVAQRCEEITLFAEDPDAAPRDERGPGLSYVCDGCPWLRECWGRDAEPGVVGAQKTVLREHGGVEEALRLYDEARARRDEAAEEMAFAKAMFGDYDTGQYGAYSFSYASEGSSPDKDAALALLTEAGIPVPAKSTKGRLIVRKTG